jgi:hypothetical protein
MNDGIVVTALDARANFGKLLRRVEEEGRSLVIEKGAVRERCYSASGTMCASLSPSPRSFGSSEKSPSGSAQIS